MNHDHPLLQRVKNRDQIHRTVDINDELFYQVEKAAGREILFEGRPKKKQYWPTSEDELYRALDIPPMFFDWNHNTAVLQEHTQYDPDTGELVSLSVEDTISLVAVRDRELERRLNGIYFMNNGELEFLTGNNYFFLTYYRIPAVGLPGYREFQRDVFYTIDLAIKSPDILGVFIAKAKKTGLSHIIASLFLNEASTIRDRAFGVMNKSQDEANDLNINFFWRAYEELPEILKPQYSHKNMHKIVFGAPLVKYTGTKKSVEKMMDRKRNKPLDTWIFSAPTKLEVKFDGPMMYFIHLDEFPKWKPSQKKIFGKVTETVKLQQTITGKIFITSYPPEEDTVGFEEGRDIYYGSKLSTIKADGLGRTSTGLIAHFVGALQSTHGTFDIHGKADEVEALRQNQGGRNECNTPEELQDRIRQYPRTEEEAWRSGGSGSTFDNIHLAEAEARIITREKEGEVLTIPGNLEWSHGVGSAVRFVPVTAAEIKKGVRASWNLYERYSVADLNKIIKDTDGFAMPSADTKFVAAADPTEYKARKDVQNTSGAPSNFSITVMSFPDVARDTALRRTASNLVVCDYLDRMDDPDDDFDNMLKTIFYFGCYILIEANKQWAVTKMKKLGFHRFLLLRQKDGSILPYEEGEANMAVTSTDDVIEAYIRALRSYLRRPGQDSDDIDYCLLLPSLRIVRNLMRFNSKRTKTFDDIVTLGLCRLALLAFMVLVDDLKKRQRKDAHIAKAFMAIVNYV